jgi:hypothetical protein
MGGGMLDKARLGVEDKAIQRGAPVPLVCHHCETEFCAEPTDRPAQAFSAFCPCCGVQIDIPLDPRRNPNIRGYTC